MTELSQEIDAGLNMARRSHAAGSSTTLQEGLLSWEKETTKKFCRT